MTITIEKKHLYIFIGIITLVLIVFCGVKACEKPDYEANANEMKINTMAACYMAADILSDYQNGKDPMILMRLLNGDTSITIIMEESLNLIV